MEAEQRVVSDIVVACGSGGSTAGIAIGLRLAGELSTRRSDGMGGRGRAGRVWRWRERRRGGGERGAGVEAVVKGGEENGSSAVSCVRAGLGVLKQ
eukprot:2178224-Rhodomonas_salina.2